MKSRVGARLGAGSPVLNVSGNPNVDPDLSSIEAIHALGPKHPKVQTVVDWLGLRRREIAIHNALQRFAGKNNWGDGADDKSGIFPAIETLQRRSGYKAHNDVEAALRTLGNSGLWLCCQVKDRTGRFQRNRYVFSAARIHELEAMREAGIDAPKVVPVKRKQYGPEGRATPVNRPPYSHGGGVATVTLANIRRLIAAELARGEVARAVGCSPR